MKVSANILAIIQSIGIVFGIVISVIIAQNTMLAVASLWIANILLTILSIAVFVLSKNLLSKIAVINNIAIVVSVIVNFYYTRTINYSYVISFVNMPDWIYNLFLAFCLIINSIFIVFYIKKSKTHLN